MIKTSWTFQLPNNYGCFGFMVVLVVLFVLRYFADFCGRLLVFCARFVLICGRFVGCADLRAFARKTGSITKTTRIFWSLEDPGIYHDSDTPRHRTFPCTPRRTGHVRFPEKGRPDAKFFFYIADDHATTQCTRISAPLVRSRKNKHLQAPLKSEPEALQCKVGVNSLSSLSTLARTR